MTIIENAVGDAPFILRPHFWCYANAKGHARSPYSDVLHLPLLRLLTPPRMRATADCAREMELAFDSNLIL
jgi:hypothetical protein